MCTASWQTTRVDLQRSRLNSLCKKRREGSHCGMHCTVAHGSVLLTSLVLLAQCAFAQQASEVLCTPKGPLY